MSDRLKEYFTREASEYLDELEQLIMGSGEPEPDQFFRLATGIRGSAQMAEARGVVVLAEALEDAARGLAAGTVKWSGELQSLAAGTVNDLKELITALGRWGSEQEDRLREAVNRWDRSGSASPGAQTRYDATPISDLFYDDAGPHILNEGPRATDSGPEPDSIERLEVTTHETGLPQPGEWAAGAAVEGADSTEAVPIGELLLRGSAAFREALALRPRIQEAARHGPSTTLDDLLDELFELVELGMGPPGPNEG